MASTNDITGDRLVNTPKRSPSVAPKASTPDSVFKVYQCANCFIKVSTSNGKCPLCGNQLDK